MLSNSLLAGAARAAAGASEMQGCTAQLCLIMRLRSRNHIGKADILRSLPNALFVSIPPWHAAPNKDTFRQAMPKMPRFLVQIFNRKCVLIEDPGHARLGVTNFLSLLMS